MPETITYQLAHSDDPAQPFAIVTNTYRNEITRYERWDIADAVCRMMNGKIYARATNAHRIDLRLAVVRAMREPQETADHAPN